MRARRKGSQAGMRRKGPCFKGRRRRLTGGEGHKNLQLGRRRRGGISALLHEVDKHRGARKDKQGETSRRLCRGIKRRKLS